MDSAADLEPTAPVVAGSGDLEGSAAEKRPPAAGDGDGAPVRKKARGGSGAVEGMRRVAEIVLVLSAMAKVRGGRSPTAAEAEMMAEARGKVAELCGEFEPKEIIPRDAVGAVMEDLGLNRFRNQRLGFSPPKMSIAEKMLFTKKKMEESKAFVPHSGSYSSQRPPVTENSSTANTVRVFPSDKPSHQPVHSGGIQSAPPLSQVPAAISTPLPNSYPSNGVKSSTVPCGLPTSQSSKDCLSQALPKVEKSHFKLDGVNGTSYGSKVKARPSSDHLHAKAPMWSLQSQSAPLAKSGPENKVLGYSSAKVEGAADKSTSRVGPEASRDQTSTTFFAQATSGSLPHQPLQNANYVPAPSIHNGHSEIARFVQKLLQPQLPQHPTWTPPSRDYMNKSLTCQVCKVAITEIESALVCDACEKGYHLKCILTSNQNGIPRGEWHCPRCLALSNGKPLPPKYGRVMRNMTAPRASLNTSGAQSSPEKKMVSDQQINQQKATGNENSGVQGPPGAVVSSNCTEWASDVTMPNARGMQGNSLSSNKQGIHDKASSESFLNKTLNSSVADLPASDGTGERSIQRMYNSESPAPEQRTDMKLKSQPPVKLSDTSFSAEHHSQAACKPHNVDQLGLPAEVTLKQCHNDNNICKGLDKSNMTETINCKASLGQEVVQANAVKTTEVGSDTREKRTLSADGLHSVDWIGNIVKVVDDRTFYRSCCISGIMYKAQDHALLRASDDRLIPYKLQAMWEDSKTKSKWINVSRCYFPGDLPEAVGQPCTPEGNEVYESNHDDSSTVGAGLIQGPCEVLPPDKYKEEFERRTHLDTKEIQGLWPVFQCKWVYDKLNGLFQPVSS